MRDAELLQQACTHEQSAIFALMTDGRLCSSERADRERVLELSVSIDEDRTSHNRVCPCPGMPDQGSLTTTFTNSPAIIPCGQKDSYHEPNKGSLGVGSR